MSPEEDSAKVYRFGPCRYQLAGRELRYAGIRVVVPLQESQVLEKLLRHPGEVVSKQVLAAVLWPGRLHGDSDRAIHNLISKLRRLHPAGAEWIVTVPKSGYRLDLAVTLEAADEQDCQQERLSAEVAGDELPASPGPALPFPQSPETTAASIGRSVDLALPVAGPRGAFGRRWVWPLLAACLLVLAGGLGLASHGWSLHRQTVAAGPVRVTVSPFGDSGGTVGEAETLREQLADALAAVPDVEVSVSHAAWSGSRPAGPIEGTGSGDLLLAGNFAAVGDHYSLNLELVRGQDGVHLVSRHYAGARSSLGTLPDRIAGDFAGYLHTGSRPEAQRLLGSTTSEQAYDDAFRAQAHLLQRSRADVEQAIDLYRRALALDPRFARAWAGLSESEVVLANFGGGVEAKHALEQARNAAQRALAIDPGNAQAHSSLGSILLQHDWQLGEAERQMRMAVGQNPGNAANHLRLAVLLADENREAEALSEIARAHEADPQWVVVYGTAMYVHLMSRRYEAAIADAQSLVALKPDWSRAQQHLGWALWYAGQHAPAIAAWKRAAELDHDDKEARLEQDGLDILERNGVRAYAEFRIARHAADGPGEEDFVLAEWYAFAGDREGTLRALEAMVRSRDAESLKMRVNPAYDFVRRDGRFIALTKQIEAADTSV